MKTLSVLGLAAASLLVSFVPASLIAHAANSQELTCRAALEGSSFVEVQMTNDATKCCYILEETEWYQTNDVLLDRFYRRQDDGKVYLTQECHRTNLAPIGGTSAGGGDVVSGSSSLQSGEDHGISSSSHPDESSSMSSHRDDGDDDDDDDDDDNGSSSSSHPDESSSMSSHPDDDHPPSDGNPGNSKPVGGAGEMPNGDPAFDPDPGTLGKSN
jgi:hypothetical protein